MSVLAVERGGRLFLRFRLFPLFLPFAQARAHAQACVFYKFQHVTSVHDDPNDRSAERKQAKAREEEHHGISPAAALVTVKRIKRPMKRKRRRCFLLNRRRRRASIERGFNAGEHIHDLRLIALQGCHPLAHVSVLPEANVTVIETFIGAAQIVAPLVIL